MLFLGMRRLIVPTMLTIVLLLFSSWGFFAHRRINQLALFTLPAGMFNFYKQNRQYLIEHAVDPDKRRYIDTLEAPRHYLDVENYEENIDSIPAKFNDALAKYGQRRLNENGIVPWQIQRSYYQLINAFKAHDSLKILKYSAELGHYIGDAHVPLHTTKNHNGQLTNQHGIHAFWESRIPELFANEYNFLVGKAVYIEDPLQQAWLIVKQSHHLLADVLNLEAKVSATFPSDQKYSFSERNNVVLKQYSEAYSNAYQTEMNGMVEKQMRAAILAIGSFWYSAWIDAGQPVLKNLLRIEPNDTEHKIDATTEMKYLEGKIIGREN
jgi:hypothetical protein